MFYAEKYGVEFLYRDFRPNFRSGNQKAREEGLYMQKYCGCIYSEEDRYRAAKRKKALENARNEKVIGSSLDAKVTLFAEDELYDFAESVKDILHSFLQMTISHLGMDLFFRSKRK